MAVLIQVLLAVGFRSDSGAWMRNRHRQQSTLGRPDQDHAVLATWYATRLLLKGFGIIDSGARSATERAKSFLGAWNKFREAEDNR